MNDFINLKQNPFKTMPSFSFIEASYGTFCSSQPKERVETKENSFSSLSPLQNEALKSLVTKILFEKPSSTSSSPSFTTGGKNCAYVISNVSLGIRELAGIKTASPLYADMGITTAFNCIQGALVVDEAIRKRQEAEKADYRWGKAEANLDVLRGAFESAGGVAYGAQRPLDIVSSLKGVNTSISATTLLGRVTFGATTAATGLFGLFYLFFSIVSGMKMFKTLKFWKKLDEGQGHLEFLVKKISNNPEISLGKIRQKFSNEKFNEKLQKEGIEFFSKRIQSDPISYELNHDIIRELFTFFDADNGLSEEDKSSFFKELGLDLQKNPELLQLNTLEFLGLKQLLENTQYKKELKLVQAIGEECTQFVKEAAESDLVQRISSTDEIVKKAAIKEAESLIEKIHKTLKVNLSRQTAYAVAGAIGVIAAILSIVLSGGTVLIVAGVLFAITALLMLCADAYALNAGLSADELPGKHDKKLVIANTVLCVLAIISAIGLCVVFPAALIPLLISMTISGAWIINNSVTLTRLHIKQKQHPSLQDFLKELELSNDNKVFELFKKLSKDNQRGIKKALHEQAGIDPSQRSFIDRTHTDLEAYSNLETHKDKVIEAVESCICLKPTRNLKELFAHLEAAPNQKFAQVYKDNFYKLQKEEQERISFAIYKKLTKNYAGRFVRNPVVSELISAVKIHIDQLKREAC